MTGLKPGNNSVFFFFIIFSLWYVEFVIMIYEGFLFCPDFFCQVSIKMKNNNEKKYFVFNILLHFLGNIRQVLSNMRRILY